MGTSNDDGPFWSLIIALPVFVLSTVWMVLSVISENRRNTIIGAVLAAISLAFAIKAAYGQRR